MIPPSPKHVVSSNVQSARRFRDFFFLKHTVSSRINKRTKINTFFKYKYLGWKAEVSSSLYSSLSVQVKGRVSKRKIRKSASFSSFHCSMHRTQQVDNVENTPMAVVLHRHESPSTRLRFKKLCNVSAFFKGAYRVSDYSLFTLRIT